MCLAIPRQIKKIVNKRAIIDYNDKDIEVDSRLIKCGVGDWVLVQNGFVVDKITSADITLISNADLTPIRERKGGRNDGKRA